jgi:type IV secretion system protein VirD4
MFNFFKKKQKPKQPQEVPTSHLILSKQSAVDLSHEHGNILVIGSSGSGKTRHFIQPNLLQAHYSYIVTDCDGNCLKTTADNFKDMGYEITVLNLYEPDKSAKYNPLDYVYSRQDAEWLAKIILGDKWKFEDRFIYDVAVKLLASLFLLSKEIVQEEAVYLRDINLLLDDYGLSMKLFEAASKKFPVSEACAACAEYEATGIKKQHFFDSVANVIKPKMEIFCSGKYKDVFCGEDELKLNRTSVKRVLYIIAPPIGGADTIVSAIYAQSILTIATVAGMFENAGRKFEHKTVMLMDDFASTTYIPDFDDLIGKCRRHICCIPFLQDIQQLRTLYPKSWENILVGMDMTLFLGGTSITTTEHISKISHIEERDVRLLPIDKCIVVEIGQVGSIEDKYRLEQHSKMKI